MKTLLLLLLISLSTNAYSQACQEVFFTDTTERYQIISYFKMFRPYTHLSLGRVIVVYRFENKGDKCWRLRYINDDKCLDECPTKYAYDEGTMLFLIHDADQDGKPLPNPNCQQSRACIEEVVQGWLYIHPRKDKWIVETDSKGNRKRVNLSKLEPIKADTTERTIRFKKDGTVVPF